MRAYMWGKAKEWLLTGAIDADPRLECDLTEPGYVVDNKIRVRRESKEDMKKRGLDSLDHGDALALTFAQTVAAPRSTNRGHFSGQYQCGIDERGQPKHGQFTDIQPIAQLRGVCK
jgi:hypothetical protein